MPPNCVTLIANGALSFCRISRLRTKKFPAEISKEDRDKAMKHRINDVKDE